MTDKYQSIEDLWAERPALTGYHVLVIYRNKRTQEVKQATAHPTLTHAHVYAEAQRHFYDIEWQTLAKGVPELPVVINLIPAQEGEST